jgi:magnesium-transporting ATPase (P-type)
MSTGSDTHVAWHALPAEEALRRSESSPSGLSAAEAARRLERCGPNRLPRLGRRGLIARFLRQVHNILIYVLLVAAGVTAVLGHWVDSGVILGVVIVNAIIGFVQEGKAEQAIDAIRRMLSLSATVVRDGARQVIPAEHLVPGDIVLLASGDKVPADLRLLKVRSLRVEEAALTGESEPVEKRVEPVAENAPLGDRFSMAYSGTLVTYGQGQGVVVATGARTEIGRISRMIEEVEELRTPLLRKLDTFGRRLTAAIIGVAAFAFAFGSLIRGYPASEMFLAAVGLAVAAIPEGLPALLTITLAVGVQRMARRKAIIRRLPAVEALGEVTVICSDKTGTLTRNEMTVKRVVTASGVIDVSGAGYAPEGGFTRDGAPVTPENSPELATLARAALACNDATLRRAGGAWRVEGDPTDGALLALAYKAGLEPRLVHDALPRTDAIPFESEHRFMATLHHDHKGRGVIYLKGAPERVLDMCTTQLAGASEAPLDRQYWTARMNPMATAGMRVLALAMKATDAARRELTFRDVESEMCLIGLVGIIDPPREEAITAVRQCRSAGIRVKMITGDHAVTALAIGRQLGLAGGRALTGNELDRLGEAELRQAVADAEVFARTSPEHKLRLVHALQADGEMVAMTGDGVNDAPALKRADVGVAMGLKGTEAAKEAAEVVLADDNFASIVHAVEQGRAVYDNLKKAIVYILPTNGGEAGIILVAIALGLVLPITPVQILWVNMVTEVTLGLALAFEPPERDVMARPPRPPREPILSGFLVWRIAFVSTLLVSASIGLFLWETGRGESTDVARTIAVNTLVMGELFYLFNSRQLFAPALAPGLFAENRWAWVAVAVLIVAQALFVHAPPMQVMFGTAPLDAAGWALTVAAGAAIFVIVEIEKAIARRLGAERRAPRGRLEYAPH